MNRPLSLLLIVLALLFGGGALLLYLAYGLDARAPGEASLPGLTAEATLAWQDDGVVAIDAASEADAYAALGYAHATHHAFQLSLWRQTAEGRLAEWFGDTLLPLDHLTRRLGLATYAREAYAALPEADQVLLAAYARGVSAGLAAGRTAYDPSLVLLELEPATWAPWHSLAVERLAAWLATTPTPADSLARPGRELQGFLRRDIQLRQWLHVHGLEHSLAVAHRDSAGTAFYQRHVYGDAALPLLAEARLRWPGGGLDGAALPGTPFFPAGRTADGGRSWALLLHSTVRYERAPVDTTQADTTAGLHHERLRSEDGTERLLAFRRYDGRLPFAPPPRGRRPRTPADSVAATRILADSLYRAAPDTSWHLRWPGLQAASDASAWLALARGQAAAFRLLDGDGLAVDAAGAWQVLGSPRVVHRLPQGLAVGNDAWGAFAAARLDTLLSRPGAPPLPTLMQDTRSSWAAGLAPALINAAATVPGPTPLVQESLTFLRNWDYGYDRASIAASIFDTWMALYRDSTGTLPTRTVADTLLQEHRLRYRFLKRAVDSLAARYGTNLSQWRWENVQPEIRHFPGAAVADSLAGRRAQRLRGDRFAPLRLPGQGHPTTPAWGPSRIDEELPATAAWEGWMHTGTATPFTVRRRRLALDDFLGRYTIPERLPEPVAIDTTANRRTTRLVP